MSVGRVLGAHGSLGIDDDQFEGPLSTEGSERKADVDRPGIG